MTEELVLLKDLIEKHTRFLIVSHKSPDGDAIGSVSGFYHFLTNLGLKPRVVLPDPPASNLLPFLKDVSCEYFDTDPVSVKESFHWAEVLICLDFNTSSRVGSMQSMIDSFTGKTALIDHHPYPAPFPSVLISDVANSSTCQLIYECISSMGYDSSVDEKVAKSLYLGIMTDTGSFRFPSVNAKTHEILSQLLGTGIKHWEIHQDVFDNNRLEQLQLRGFAISEKMVLFNDRSPQYPFGYISLSKEDLERFNYQSGDTEGLVNAILSVTGIKVGVLLQEKRDGIKMSFRAKDGISVNDLASAHFNGGGHKYAAGGISNDTMEVTLSKLLSLLPTLFKE